MAENGENKPVESKTQAEQGIPQPEETGDNPEVQAVISKSKDSRSDWRMPLISAVAALLGALVGAASSYSVAQSGDEHKAQAALLAKRQTDYANFLATEMDIKGVEETLMNYFSGTLKSKDLYDQAGDQYNVLHPKAVNADYVVALSASPKVDETRKAIADYQTDIDKDIHTLVHETDPKRYQSTLQDLSAKIDQLDRVFCEFTNAARTIDLNLPPRTSTTCP